MTLAEAKSRAYKAALDAFIATMKEHVDEAGLAQLAGSEADEHLLLIATADGGGFTMHVRVEYGPAQAPGPDVDF